jgi:hypothetical protein
MVTFQRILCPMCNQPLQPVFRRNRIVYICGCQGLEREIGGEDRELQSGALQLGQEEDDGLSLPVADPKE